MKSTLSPWLWSLFSLVFFALLLFFPKVTVAGASAGLLLWYRTLLPTLLPTMILADYLIRIDAHILLIRWLQTPISLLFGTSPAGSYGVLVGFLCGYPMGAKTAATLLKQQSISPREANYLLAFTNQPSPMFLIGYLCLSFQPAFFHMDLLAPVPYRDTFSVGTCIFITLCSIYSSAYMISVCHRALWHLFGRPIRFRTQDTPLKRNKTTDSTPLSLLEISMMTSFEVMGKIGGYLMLFSIVEQWILLLPGLPYVLRLLFLGLVEMTTGINHMITGISFPWSLSLCIGVSAFGGLSGYAQTANLIQNSGLSAAHYLLWKLLQGILATVIALLLTCFLGYYPVMS